MNGIDEKPTATRNFSRDSRSAIRSDRRQAVEHYEITRYQSLIAWASEMGRNDFADILREDLAEETAANERLGSLAIRSSTGGLPVRPRLVRPRRPRTSDKTTTRGSKQAVKPHRPKHQPAPCASAVHKPSACGTRHPLNGKLLLRMRYL